MDPSLQLQNDIGDKFNSNCSPLELFQEPDGVDSFVFRYEMFRQFLVVLNQLAIKLIEVWLFKFQHGKHIGLGAAIFITLCCS